MKRKEGKEGKQSNVATDSLRLLQAFFLNNIQWRNNLLIKNDVRIDKIMNKIFAKRILAI